MEKSIKLQIHKITLITDNNGKTEYHGRTYANNLVALESGWICDNFEFREPEFYKIVTTVTCDKTKHKTYTVPVGIFALHTSVYVPNFVDMNHNTLICLGESKKKEEPSKISDDIKNAYALFLVHLPYYFHKSTRIHVLYHPWRQHCIIFMINLHQNISSGLSKSLFLSFIIKAECNSAVIFLWDVTEKKTK